jgi:hypothetical protein
MSRFELDKSPLHGEDFFPRRTLALWRFHKVWIKAFAANVAHHQAELFDSGGIRLPDTFAGGSRGWESGYHPGGGDTNADGNEPRVCNVPSVRQVGALWEQA